MSSETERTGPSPRSEPYRRARWFIAVTVWIACTATSAAVLMGAADWMAVVRVVVAFPAMIGLALYFAAWIQRRPPESMQTVIASTFISAIVAGVWLVSGPGMIMQLQLVPVAFPIGLLLEMPSGWRVALGVFLQGLPISLTMFFLLMTWMPVRTKLALSVLSSLGFLISTTVLAEWLSLNASHAAAVGPTLICSLTGTILAWACLARPYSRDWVHQCRDCNYDLRGLDRDTCPECGAPIPKWMLDELRGVTLAAEAAQSEDPIPAIPPPLSTPQPASPSATPAPEPNQHDFR